MTCNDYRAITRLRFYAVIESLGLPGLAVQEFGIYFRPIFGVDPRRNLGLYKKIDVGKTVQPIIGADLNDVNLAISPTVSVFDRKGFESVVC